MKGGGGLEIGRERLRIGGAMGVGRGKGEGDEVGVIEKDAGKERAS